MALKNNRTKFPVNVTVSKVVFDFIEENRREETRSQYVENLLRAGIHVWNSKKGDIRDSRRLL